MGSFIDLTGQRFGFLTVVERIKCNDKGIPVWLCKCDCGNTKIVMGARLRNGETKSCGCGIAKRKHGMSQTKLDFAYRDMIRRCYNVKCISYQWYGARGIVVCDEWKDKERGKISFFEWALNNGYMDNLTLDRIDVNGNYEPSNCRWVDAKTQANNRRTCKFISYNGETHSMKEWAKILDVPYARLSKRAYLGWSDEEIIGINKLKTWKRREKER